MVLKEMSKGEVEEKDLDVQYSTKLKEKYPEREMQHRENRLR
jgi:hypothetical protein